MSRFLLFLLLVALVGITVSSARIQKRLVNGNVATYGQVPWMVSLRSTTTASHFCGGSIVTPDHVITAAHCVADNVPTPYLPDELFVVTGHLSNIEGGRFTRISEVRIHPDYQPSATWRNDVAVLKLATPIPYTATEQPIPLASADVGVQPCFASGWGRIHHPSRGLPSQLQWSIQNTMTRETCTEFWPAEAIFDSTLCAGASRGSGVCSGDSGGPLVCNGELAGVASWANLCANGLPDAWARVFYYREWFEENISDLSTLGRIYADQASNARKGS